MSKKITITSIVIKNLQHIDQFKNKTPNDLLLKWWMTGRISEGLRLTDDGKKAFEQAEITHYDFDIKLEKPFVPQHFILELQKKIQCPYYIGVNKIDKTISPYIRLYDNKIAMMLSLYGNIQEYLKSLKVKNDRRKEKPESIY